MRIGTQRYGFQGFDIVRAPAAAVKTTTPASTIASAETNVASSNSNSNLAKLRGLLSDLRTLAAKPAATTTNSQQASTQQDQALLQEQAVLRNVDYLTVVEPTTYEISRTSVQGANSAQVSNIEVSKYESPAPVTISGNVTTAATYAELTIEGDSQARTTEDAQYTLTTERGVFQFQFSGGETLQDVATRLTDQHHETGVVAEVSGNNLVLRSTTIGSAARIQLERTDTSPTIVSGQNTLQISTVNATQTTGKSDVLSGTIDSQAKNAELVYQGAANQTIADSSAFRLTGSAGSILVSVTKGESLAAVAQRLNQQSASTGVVVTQDNNTLRFTSVDKGSAESVRIDQVVQTETITSSGRNAAQVSSFAIDSINRGETETISGQVTQTAGKASLAIQGSASSTVISTGSFALRGNSGTANISITKDETLSAVATRINDVTNSTGVTARVDSNQLILESSGIGSAAEVEVDLLSLPYTLTNTGRNAAQLSSFDVQSFTNGATQTFTGTVTQAAGVAEFSFRGSSFGFVNKNATFTLTGSQGSKQFSVTTTQTLANLESQVNAQTTNTGVTATVSGRNIYFRSTGVGSVTEINLHVNSGTFAITGGDANGSAFGTDAEATINGVVHTGAGNNFSFSDAKGSYTFTTVQGYTGSLSTITVTSTAGTFNLAGGDGQGLASGTDATAVINGQQLTGTANNFNVTTTKGEFSVAFAQGFTGTFDSITARSTVDDFSFSGGDPSGTASGSDFVVNVNGTQYRGLSNTITHTTANGSYEMTFDTNHVGQFDPLTISTSAGPQVSGGYGAGDSVGTDAVATLNGRTFTAQADQFEYSDAHVNVSFKIAVGFTGQIDPLTVTTQKELVTTSTTRTIESPDSINVSKKNSANTNTIVAATEESQLNSILTQIDAINSLTTTDTEADPVSSAENALAIALPDPNAKESLSVPNDPGKLTRAQVTGLLYQRLAENLVVNTSPSIEQLLRINLSLFKNNVDVEA
jgi:hypothetical protein